MGTLKYLGKTGIEVPAIGVGTMGIGGYFTRDTSQDAFYVRILRKSIDAGMTFIDTAELYGEGHAEELIGRAVQGIRDKVFIASKVAPQNLRYDDVIKSAEGSLRRLRTEYIDLYQIHWPNPAVNLRETLWAMRYLIRKGKVRHVGLCNFLLRELIIAKEMANKMEFDIVSTQVEYNLVNRTIEDDLLPYCQKNGITVIAYSPLDKGNLNRYNELESIARKYNKTVAQLILAWIISHENVNTIVKSESEYHIKDNANADFKLQKEDIEFINNIYKMKVIEIPANKILASSEGLDKMIPGIPQLAQSILEGTILKPIRVKNIGNGIYELLEGKARYWAYVHAYGKKVSINSIVAGKQ